MEEAENPVQKRHGEGDFGPETRQNEPAREGLEVGAERDPTTEPVDPWYLAELACWTMVVLAPILTWVNGPSVSTDQFVVRTAVFSLALSGGIGIRLAKVVAKRRKGP